MKLKLKKGLFPVAWFFYLVIVFEIIYMILPFFAFTYYSSYGPSLNFLNRWSGTSWLTTFFLPHICETSSPVLNPKTLYAVGSILFLGGLLFFLIGAGQIYFAKFFKKGAVNGGLYRFMRHPQYTAFSIMGFGLLIIWPRFIILVMYITMLFLYYLLARKEEKECEKKYGDSFRKYLQVTPMFLPFRFTKKNSNYSHPRSSLKKTLLFVIIYCFVLVSTVALSFLLKNRSIASLYLHAGKNDVTVSAMAIEDERLEEVMGIALSNVKIRKRLEQEGWGQGIHFLNYLVPAEWILADLPMEAIPEGTHGHVTPVVENPVQFKLLFTKAKLYQKPPVFGKDILKWTYAREPILLAKVDVKKNGGIILENPPQHVVWGDIPTPLF